MTSRASYIVAVMLGPRKRSERQREGRTERRQDREKAGQREGRTPSHGLHIYSNFICIALVYSNIQLFIVTIQ